MERRRAIKKFLSAPGPIKYVSHFLNYGTIQFDAHQSIPYNDGSLWDPRVPRGLGRKTHGWFFLPQWGAAYSSLNKEERSLLLDEFGRMLPRWIEKSQVSGTMAFHDETTAKRVINVLLALDSFGGELSQHTVSLAKSIIENDLNLLVSDEFYAGNNNHGMFQNIGILFAVAYGLCPNEAETFENLALERLARYFSTCFTMDGVHTENSPTYHLMISRHLRSTLSYAATVGKTNQFVGLKGVLPAADKHAAFALNPAGKFLPISDTNWKKISVGNARDAFGDGLLLGAVTHGKEGVVPDQKVYVAENSGYAALRSGWEGEGDRYVFFNAAYNADYHKHSDELSVYVFAKGEEIITESGPYGYERTDPFTEYAFSSFAHNTLLVDGRGLPRVERQKASLTSVVDNGSNSDFLNVTGKTLRYEDVTWSRNVMVDSSEGCDELVIRDHIQSAQKHKFTLLWHFGPKIRTKLVGSVLEIFRASDDEKLAEFSWMGSSVKSLQKVKGQTDPEIQGWYFPRPGVSEEAECVQFEFEGDNIAVFWNLRLENFLMDKV